MSVTWGCPGGLLKANETLTPSLLKAVMAGKEGADAGAAVPKASPRPPNASKPLLGPAGAAEGGPASKFSKSCTHQALTHRH